MKLQSQYSGHFVKCKCGSYVDSTPHYTRVGGNTLKLVHEGSELERGIDRKG
jgi:hypothetical protein